MVALVVSVRYAIRPEPRLVALVVGFSIVTMIFGVLGTIVGMQTTMKALTHQGAVDPVILPAGLRESLNNVVLACMIAALAATIATIGRYRAVSRKARAGAGDSLSADA